jgi:antitoxin MazE
MLRKIFKTGNSMVISIPKDVVDFLGLSPGTEVSVDLDRDNRQVVITPIETPLADAGIDETFNRQVAEFIEQYRTALEALAKK